ncbi:MAG: hypothetical protein HYU30_09380 [Chloroflexi bacterium]|nr:hypothetical protein [Chloroflexota bacterium]
MRGLRLFELEDQAWLPRPIRDAGTDYIRFMWERGAYQPIVRRLKEALIATGSRTIVDLCSGGGGPVVAVQRALDEAGLVVDFILTDKYPNIRAFQYAHERFIGRIRFIDQPVDAAAVPDHLNGFRTMFAALHHFSPEAVRRTLQDAVVKHQPIALFDMTRGTPPPPSMAILGNPLGVVLAAPFVRPFRWSRLFWTYLVPIVPLYLTWDAFVSGLRLHSAQELQELVASLPPNDYVWQVGGEKFPRSITYVLGYPQRNAAQVI